MLSKLKITTIFWKIFLSYWVAMILTIVITAVFVSMVFDRDQEQIRRRMSDDFHATTAMLLYEQGGAPALRHWLGRRGPRRLQRTFFVNDELEDVLGKPLPDSVVNMIQGGDSSALADKSHRWVVQSVSSSAGEAFWYVGQIHNRPPRHRAGLWPMQPPGFLRHYLLLVSVVISGVISFLLARHFSRPIRYLQSAARGISSGNLAQRVDPKLQRRSDEFGELGQDFDRMAEQIEQLVAGQKRLLGDVSHELRSPLARLQVALELARNLTGNAAVAEHDRIETEAQKLDELIGQVLALVRLSTRTEALETQSVDIVQMLGLIVEDANFEAQGSGRAAVLAHSPPTVLDLNEELIHSAIENIVRNALRYTHEDTQVEITLSREDGWALLRIRDHGNGVAEQALSHLFEAFYREGEARDRASGGYGLGLAIAERAVVLHGGTITASNASGGGLAVEIRLPVSGGD